MAQKKTSSKKRETKQRIGYTKSGKKIKKILLLGSGAIKIGQAGEFDYSGSQAIKSLKEEGIKTILINPNIATIQTSEYLADEIYFVPITIKTVEEVIKKEKPDGLLLSFGGQTALNCGVELKNAGILKKYGIEVLGTPVHSIEITEDRKLFAGKLKEINAKTPLGIATHTVEEGLKAAAKLGYPVMTRVAYALGGLGSGICTSEEQLREKLSQAFTKVPQVLIEEYLKGWKEVEYEVVRDRFDNCVTVCNMENFDPMGIHTGESIVVAPSQTLSNKEYHMLREVSIRVIRYLGIVGECNIQFAFNPQLEDYRIIEVNARLSRSSALASKATGYPLAFVAAKLALGYALPDITNSITHATKACFEPALDYIVVKIPRWDLGKFRMVTREIGTEMKSVGEVMAIGRSFEEALQKALRMIGTGMEGLVANDISFKHLEKEIKEPTDERIFAIAKALSKGMSIDKIYQMSHIDKWFLHKLHHIVELSKRLSSDKISKELLLESKQLGFSDIQIAKLSSKQEKDIRALRTRWKMYPFFKQIDTLAAEYPAQTNYLYLTYHGVEDDVTLGGKNQVVVLGSGAYRIGSSVEFDWCCVTAVNTLRSLGYKTIMLNYNPETVSTDYDICDKLIFDEISYEIVMDIYEKEKPMGVLLSMGGQIPNNIALPLHKSGVKVLGTSPKSIDGAEDRHKFSSLLDELGIDQPEWKELTSIQEAKKFASRVGYPVLIRPSYVLSGAAMAIALNEHTLVDYLAAASKVGKDHPVVISKFITGAKEVEIDAVANNGELVCFAISEHVENAGVHSGDATMVLPPQQLYLETTRRIKKIAREVARALHITGPFNMQFLAKQNKIKVIECNLRASRSFPFVSKVFKINFIDLATKAMMGKHLPKVEKSAFDLDYVGVKAPQFSFSRLKGSDPTLTVEMSSTGEVACFGDDLHEAFLKSFLSVGYTIPKKNILLSTGPAKSKGDLLEGCKLLLQKGYNLFGSEGTAEFLKENGVTCKRLAWPDEKDKGMTITEAIRTKKIDLVINIPKSYQRREVTNGYKIRRAAIDFNIPLITNTQVARLFIDSLIYCGEDKLQMKAWSEYRTE
jgi:carbamoyl-phosphate synthase large subunit